MPHITKAGGLERIELFLAQKNTCSQATLGLSSCLRIIESMGLVCRAGPGVWITALQKAQTT